MRKVQIVFAAACMAAFFVFIATISAGAQTSGDGSSDPEGGFSGVSQGTLTGASQSELEAVRRDLAQEERLPDYSQVVDDTTTGRIAAPGWQRGATDDLAHGGSYAFSGSGTPNAKDLRFKLNVPTASDYSLYVWYPASAENSTAARFGVRTSSGTRWTTVNQKLDGGYWVKVGDYDMSAGDYYAVTVSPGNDTGRVVADAVALVRGVTAPPPDDLAPLDGGAVSKGVALDSDDVTYSASRLGGRVTGRQLIRFGKRHLRTPYRLSPPAPCLAYEKEDCSCFTKLVFRHFGKRMPDSPIKQWQYGHRVRSKSNLRRGDLLFWKEGGYGGPITHVGLYAGNGYTLHASSYFGKVVITKMRYLNGYYGAKRVRPRL
jgi:cell wall-associated NlpC family hydrolase